jgi:Uma2 family endonuclease
MTNTIASPQEGTELVGAPRRYDWTVDLYHRVGDMGLFDPDVRTELVEGEVFYMSPIGLRHSVAFENVFEALGEVFSVGFRVLPERPIRLSDLTELQPDVLVVRGDRKTFETRYPEPSDVALLVEVSDATLTYDRGRKLAIYARAGIAEYWIVNLIDRRLEVHRDPAGDVGYRTTLLILPGQQIDPLFAPGKPVAVDDLLPPVL